MSSCKTCGASMSINDRFCPECGADQQASRMEGLMTVGAFETLDPSQAAGDSRGAAPELAEGAEFAGRYVIEAIVGRGGMGVVYKAHDRLADKAVALKLIRADRLAGQGAVRRLISEGITARDIRHQNIVAVYDAGESDGQPFVSMEFLKGQSLRDWHREKVRRREDVPLRVAARIVAEVLDGLSAAHAAGVIHRDLKPENIMLVAEPDEASAPLKILDFGIARAAGRAPDGGTGTGLGTPRYMAPEQITHADTVGPEADLYSLSVIFYELLVDVLPQGHWQPPSGGRSDVPQGIDLLIERGLSNRPANRPSTASVYRKKLVDAVNIGPPGRTVRTVVPEPANDSGAVNNPAVSGVSRRWLKWGGIGVLALIGIAILGSIDSEQAEGSPYGSLEGNWNDGVGNVYSVRFNENGSFSGSGQSSYGGPIHLSGQFNGRSGTFDLTAPGAGIALSGRMLWDGECHIDYQAYDRSGQYTDQGRMHVNHLPGGPCP